MRSHFIGSLASPAFANVVAKSERFRWSDRKISISQSVPVNWRTLAEEDALRICHVFRSNNVDVEIAADETFMQFHAAKDRCIAPVGVKRTGKVNPVDNEKVGFTVVVAAERRSSQLLPPSGKFGGDLFKVEHFSYADRRE